ncbi:MAG: hypothetical protein ACRERD_33690 [Candidatus Binatia bacterium]
MNCKELTVERLVVKDPRGKGQVEISGREIVLRDDRGVTRIELQLDYRDGCPSIALSDAIRQERIKLNVNSSGGANISLLNEHDRAAVWLTTECGTRICLYDQRDNARLDCSIDEDDGDPIIELGDRHGHTRAELTLDHESGAVIATYNAEETKLWAAPAKEEKVQPQQKEG